MQLTSFRVWLIASTFAVLLVIRNGALQITPRSNREGGLMKKKKGRIIDLTSGL